MGGASESVGPPATAPGAEGASEYVKLSEAAREMRCHPSVVQRLALLGSIWTRVRGGRVLYRLGSV